MISKSLKMSEHELIVLPRDFSVNMNKLEVCQQLATVQLNNCETYCFMLLFTVIMVDNYSIDVYSLTMRSLAAAEYVLMPS